MEKLEGSVAPLLHEALPVLGVTAAAAAAEELEVAVGGEAASVKGILAHWI